MKHPILTAGGAVALTVVLAGGVLWYVTSHQTSATPQAPLVLPIAHPFGTVTAVSDAQLTLASVNNTTVVVHIDQRTNYTMGSSSASLSDVNVGGVVSITESINNPDGSLTAQSIDVLPARPAPRTPTFK